MKAAKGKVVRTNNRVLARWVIGVALFVVALWMLSPLFFALLDFVYASPDVERTALWGDSLGGIGVLFSGFAFVVVAVALVLEIEGRRRDDREKELSRLPLLLPDEAGLGVSLELVKSQQSLQGNIHCALVFKNNSSHPALNIQVTVRVSGLDEHLADTRSHAIPVAADSSFGVSLEILARRNSAIEVVKALSVSTAGIGLRLDFDIRCSNVGQVNWHTSFSATARFASTAEGPDALAVLAGEAEAGDAPRVVFLGEPVDLLTEVIPGTWKIEITD